MRTPEMKTLTRSLSIAIVVCAAIATFPPSVFGWSHNEHQNNNTGATAYDVVKILEGDYTITDMMTWDFADTDYYHRTVGGEMQTVLRWTNGTVPAGTAGDVCFTAVPLGGSASHAKIIGAWWTDQHDVPMGNYNPTISAQFDFADLNNPLVQVGNLQAGQIAVNAANPNFWEEGDFTLTGNAAPMNGVQVWAAVVDVALGPPDLFVEKTIFDTGPGGLADSFFDVFTDLSIAGGATIAQPLGRPVALGQSVVLVADLGEGNYDLFNFVVPEPCTMLLLGLGFLGVLGHRRKH